jgi:hypothetical protein
MALLHVHWGDVNVPPRNSKLILELNLSLIIHVKLLLNYSAKILTPTPPRRSMLTSLYLLPYYSEDVLCLNANLLKNKLSPYNYLEDSFDFHSGSLKLNTFRYKLTVLGIKNSICFLQ